MDQRRLGFIGAGNMAAALIQGVLERGGVEPASIRASDASEERAKAVNQQLGVQVGNDNAGLAQWAETVVLAVKPQVVADALASAAREFARGKLLISVCAGVPISRLQTLLGDESRVIRAMPNTPALVGAGATALARGSRATDEDLQIARQLFECVGICVEVDESSMDAVTGLSGSGPAYVLMAIEALSDAGVRVGLPRKVAFELALHTVMGTARLVSDTGEHPAVLRERVTSPGGTTISGIHALEAAGFRNALLDAVSAATARSRELGRPPKE